MVVTVCLWLPAAAYLLSDTVGWKRAVVLVVIVVSGVAIWVAASYLPEGKPCNVDCVDIFPG
nr:hypothetical protein KPHV_64290 [Kitasatospora purpeofusca]